MSGDPLVFKRDRQRVWRKNLSKHWTLGRLLLLTVAAMMISAGSSASENPSLLDEDAVIEDYLAYAALNNPGLKAAFQSWHAALEEIPQVSALPDPRFNYSYLIREVETRVGPQRQKFALLQTFPWFGKLDLKGDRAARMAEAGRQRYESAKRKLFYKVIDAYVERAYLDRAIDVASENLDLAKYLEQVVRSRYKTGASSHSDLIRAQVERGKLEDRLASLKDLTGPSNTRLNSALGRSAGAPLPGNLAIPTGSLEVDSKELIKQLVEENPDLLTLDELSESHRLSMDLARKQFRPDFTLGIEYMETGEALMPDQPDTGKDPVAAMFSINLPIWRGKYRAAENQAASLALSADLTRRDRELDLVSRLERALFAYRDAERKTALYRDNLIPQGRQALSVTEEAFKAGKVGFTSLVDSQRILLEFQLNYERARADRAQRLAEIEMLAGSATKGTSNE